MDVEEEEEDEIDEDDVEEDQSQDRKAHFVRACAVEMHMDKVRRPFCMEIYRKYDRGHLRDIVLCELPRSTCTWTCHKRHFVRKLAGKMPDPTDTTSIEHRAFALTVRTTSVWPHCLGTENFNL